MKPPPTTLYKFAALLFLSGVLLSLFMPFFQTETDGMQREPYRFISQYETNEGFLTTYNGFGSLFGILNASWSALLLIIVVLFGVNNKLLIRSVTVLFILSHFFVLLDLISAPFMLSDPDNLLAGYFLLSLSETGILICLSKNLQKSNKQYFKGLFDDPE